MKRIEAVLIAAFLGILMGLIAVIVVPHVLYDIPLAPPAAPIDFMWRLVPLMSLMCLVLWILEAYEVI